MNRTVLSALLKKPNRAAGIAVLLVAAAAVSGRRDAGAGTILFDHRIMVTAMSLRGRCCNPRVSRLLKMQLETLLQGEIQLYVECDQNIFTKQFKLSDGSALLAVFNF